MKFKTQKLAYYAFAICMGLFAIQIIYGFIMAFDRIALEGLHSIAPFNTARAVHTTALQMWLLLGLMGAAYFIIPEETKSEIPSERLGRWQIGALGAIVVITLIGFHFDWWIGRKFFEMPHLMKLFLVADFMIFLYLIGIPLFKSKQKTTTAMVLYAGLFFMIFIYLPTLFHPANHTTDSFWRGWVGHLVVEGVWEIILGAIFSFLLIKLLKVNREKIEKWLYVIVGCVFISGILGVGHHFYYIGTPKYWLWVGGLFSAMEPVTFFVMAFIGIRELLKTKQKVFNKTALLWTLGCAVMSVVGAGVLGFLHTLPKVNLYTHGTLVTATHGHLAFWGCYAMLVLAMITYTMPILTRRHYENSFLNQFAFWASNIGMILMTLVFGLAGMVQVYRERLLGMDFMLVQNKIEIFFIGLILAASLFTAGVIAFIVNFMRFGLPVASKKSNRFEKVKSPSQKIPRMVGIFAFLLLLVLAYVVIQKNSNEVIVGEEIAILTEAPLVPPPITRKFSTKVIVNLEVREVTKRLADGVEYTFWTFGGSVPGKFIRIREGDLVEFTLSNHPSSKMPHNIDLHAVTGPGGGAAASFTAPGHSSKFSFKALNPGLYVYHCATAPVGMHIANGMYGLILVEPKKGLPPVDKEYYVMQGEFYTPGEYGKRGLQSFDLKKAIAEQPEYVVFNGSVGALTGENAITAKVGEKIRLFVGNGGPNLVSSFHVIGEIFDTVYLEGGLLQNHQVQTTLVPAGGSTIVEFKVDVPGVFILVDHSIFRTFNKGSLGMLKVTGPDNKMIYSGKISEQSYLPKGSMVPATTEKKQFSVTRSKTQRIANGKSIFSQNCMVCHQTNGQGVEGYFPPLSASDFLNKDKNRAIGVVVNGLTGEIVVSGKKYNGIMPAQALTDDEIADVLTYVYNSWGNSGKDVSAEEVKIIRSFKKK